MCGQAKAVIGLSVNTEPQRVSPRRDAPIGVFDSGVGGISVLRELRAMLPEEDFIYFGDSANAPYGEKSGDEIRALAWHVVETLLKSGIKALVIACNTATAAAAPLIRERLDMPVVAMEPALKPASKCAHGGKVLVMATPLTLSLDKFQSLMERYGKDALPMPCPGLMELVERGIVDGSELDEYIADMRARIGGEHVDAVVLGCTHYVFLRAAIERAFPQAQVVDGNEGTARQLVRLLEQRGLKRAADGRRGGIQLMSSGGEEDIALMRRLLGEG
jgi:glutamate racemase